MRRRREQRSARTTGAASPKVSNKLKSKQQGLTNGKSESEETSDQAVLSTATSINKKGN